MSLFKDHIGINLTSGKLQIVEVCPDSSNFFLNTVDEEFFKEFFSPDLVETKAISLLESAFHDLQLRNKLSTNLVSFSLPNNFFKIITLPFEETLMKEDLKENLNWNLSVLFPNENFIDYTVQTVELTKKNFLTVIAIKTSALELIHKFCVRNNLILKYVDNAHLSANLVVKSLSNLDVGEKALSIFISESNISFLAFDNSKILSFSSKHIDNYQKIVELVNNFSKLNNLFELKEISKSFIFGDNISDSLIEQIGNTLNLIPIKINPFQNITLSDSVKSELIEEHNNSFVAAAGISFRMV